MNDDKEISDKEMTVSLNNSFVPFLPKMVEKDLKPEEIDKSMFYVKEG